MRPETVWELVVVIVAVVAAFIASLVIEFQLLADTTAFRIIKYSGLAVTLGFGIRHWVRAKPFVDEFKPDRWTVTGKVDSVGDFWLEIPKSLHKKGKYPRVEILRSPHDIKPISYVPIIDDEGNIKIHVASNDSMSPLEPLRIKVTT